jgi:hypothetical protein
MKAKMLLVLLMVLIAALLTTSPAFAYGKLLCVTKEKVTGEQSVNSCLANGDRFAVIDEYGLVRILSPEEVALSKAYNPKVFERRAYGVKQFEEAPWMVPLPIPSYVPGG